MESGREHSNQASQADGKPRLLAAETYRDRFEAHQVGTSRAALILLAIAAFWLAIEGGYTRFRDGRASADALPKAEKALERSGRLQVYNEIRGRPAPAQLPPAAASDEPSLRPDKGKPDEAPGEAAPIVPAPGAAAGAGNEDLAKKAERVAKLEKDIEELRKASVTLSIAGTNLPPQLTLAPIVWLGVLLVWLIYFEWRRGQAHRNLLLYDLAVDPGDRKEGSAGEGIFWLAPLPSLQGADGSRSATAPGAQSRLVALVGWDPGTERSYRIGLATIFVLLALVATRVAWIGLELSSSSARDMKLIDPVWRFASIALVAGFFILCMVHVSRVIQGRSDVGSTDAKSFLSRRQLIVGAGAMGVAGLLLAGAERRLSLGGLTLLKAKQGGGRSNAPRFVDPSRRIRRLERYRVYFQVPPVRLRERLYFSSRPSPAKDSMRRLRTIWAADGTGRIRLYSAARDVRHMTAMTGTDLLKAVDLRAGGQGSGGRPELLRPNPNRTNAFEMAAIRHLEEAAGRPDPKERRSPIEQAFNILLAGIRLNLSGPSRRPNLRLMDLLAGLAERYGDQARRDELIRLLEDRRFDSVRAGWLRRTKTGMVDPVGDRIRKWRDPGKRWRRDWARPDKVWHYTAETEPHLLSRGMTVIADPKAVKPKRLAVPPAAPVAARPGN